MVYIALTQRELTELWKALCRHARTGMTRQQHTRHQISMSKKKGFSQNQVYLATFRPKSATC